MKKLTYLFLLFFSLKITAQNSNTILLENVNIVSPEKNNVYKGYILIENSIIKEVSIKRPSIKKRVKIINLEGKYIIPGLIDNHVHVSGVNGFTDDQIKSNSKLVKSFKEQLPKSYLYYGYTTIIDLATPSLDAIEDFNKATIKPDLFHVGSGAVIGNGYGITNWNDTVPNFIHVDNKNHKIPEKYNKAQHTVAKVVARIKKSGAIGVKTYYEPGFDPSAEKMPVPNSKIMNELLGETRENNLILMVHANSVESHGFISNYNVNVLSHGLWRWGNLQLTKENEIPKKIKSILDLEIKNNIAYTPTLQVINGLRALAEPSYLDDKALQNVVPNSVLQWYKNHEKTIYQEVFGDAPKQNIVRNFNRINNQGKASLKYIYDNNGTIVFGTDTPSSLTYGNPPGYNGYLEMKTMYEAGIPLQDILKSATLNNAKVFNLAKEYGTIETGKVANLVIMTANPLETIEAYNSIESIIIRGKLVQRNKLRANQAQ